MDILFLQSNCMACEEIKRININGLYMNNQDGRSYDKI